MTRSHGRCPVGQRLVMDVPHGHWQTTTFVAALRSQAMTAPVVADGAMTGDLFVA
jgi:transposase